MIVHRERLELLPVHCHTCRGRGQRLQTLDGAILRADCPDCAGTGMRDSNASSSAQPHRFRSVEFGPHPMAD